MHQQLSLHPVKTLAQSAQEYSRCAQWNSPQNKVRSQKSFEALHEGFILYVLFNFASRLTRSIFIEEYVSCCFFAYMEDSEINLLLQVCFGHLLVWFS